jgi:hypothetical protein
MDMSLDYMGKLVIVMVVVAVSVGIITQFRGQIDDNLGRIGGDDQTEEGLEIIEVSGNSEVNVADAVRLCYERSLERSYESFECFVVRKSSGFNNLQQSSLESNLRDEVKQSTNFINAPYDGETIVVKYEVPAEKVVVEQ